MKYIKLFKDTLEVVETLSDEQSGQIFKAIINYSNDEEVKLDGIMNAVFFQFKQQIDRAKSDYNETCNRNKANGSKGGRPKPTKTHSVINKPTQSQDKDKDKDKEENKSIYELFISDLKSKVKIKSKVTSTKEGKILFKSVKDIEKLKADYINHQLDKKEFSQRITAFMEDYNPISNNNNMEGKLYTGSIYG